jgi:tRNA dimethylallyltransferase
MKPKLIVIVGPTAVGKTELSIQLAEQLDGEIVSADSRLFSPADRQRVPHHLVDVAEPQDAWSLALFQHAAQQAIADIQRRGRLPFLVGGTGQYIHAVTYGWQPPATKPNAVLRNVLENLAASRGRDWLHVCLARLDPPAAASIDPRNLRRTVRALEVIFATGKRFSEQRGVGDSPYRLLTIGLNRPRQDLYARLDARIEAMFAQGMLDEVRTLLEHGVTPDLPSMTAIGYRQSVQVLQGEMTLAEAKLQMRRLTRTFVRRQANWFKLDDPGIHWFEAGQDALDRIKIAIQNFLKQA